MKAVNYIGLGVGDLPPESLVSVEDFIAATAKCALDKLKLLSGVNCEFELCEITFAMFHQFSQKIKSQNASAFDKAFWQSDAGLDILGCFPPRKPGRIKRVRFEEDYMPHFIMLKNPDLQLLKHLARTISSKIGHLPDNATLTESGKCDLHRCILLVRNESGVKSDVDYSRVTRGMCKQFYTLIQSVGELSDDFWTLPLGLEILNFFPEKI